MMTGPGGGLILKVQAGAPKTLNEETLKKKITIRAQGDGCFDAFVKKINKNAIKVKKKEE